jgi:hypothetical protein
MAMLLTAAPYRASGFVQWHLADVDPLAVNVRYPDEADICGPLHFFEF